MHFWPTSQDSFPMESSSTSPILRSDLCHIYSPPSLDHILENNCADLAEPKSQLRRRISKKEKEREDLTGNDIESKLKIKNGSSKKKTSKKG